MMTTPRFAAAFAPALFVLCGLATAPSAYAQSISSAYTVVGPSDTIIAPFATPGGTFTNDVFSGPVEINVSGTGMSYFTNVNDAFYFTSSQTETSPSNGDFELAIGTPTHPLVGEADGQGGKTDAIKYDIVYINGVGPVAPGTIPAYSATNTYDFVIDVPNPTPTLLSFGVNDGDYNDNSGEFTVTATQLAPNGASPAPEPSQVGMLALMALGVGGLLLRARKREMA